jgi:PAS domain S-box-containing protein
MSQLSIDGLPEGWLSDAVLDAANAARIGVCVSKTTVAHVQNVYANEAACDILGWPRDELLAKDALDLLQPQDRETIDELRERLRLTPGLAAVTCIRKDGRRVTVEFASVGFARGADRIIVSFFVDATAKKEAERVRAASEERLRLLVTSAPDGIVISRGPIILYANPAAAKLLGHTDASELVGKSFAEYLDASSMETMAQRIRSAAGQCQRLTPHEYRARRADGGRVITEITSVPIEFDGAPAVLGFARDVTERTDLRQQVARADRLASLGTLAAGVAHEINNPLTFITLGVGILAARLEEAPLPPEQRAALLGTLAEVRQGTERVAKIVRELTTFARSEPERAEPVDIVSAIEAAARIVAHRTRHVARVEIACPTLPPVFADPSKIEQVFVNLVLNAAQAFESHRPENLIRIEGAPDGAGSVAVSVIDNGPGIPAEALGRVFDPFFSTKPVGEGTGLGLALCHGIVTRLGGHISAESAPGRTCFRVVMPLASETSVAPAAANPPEPAGATTRRRILVVDDDPSVASAMRVALAGVHDVTVTESAESALGLLDGGGAFDAILCDLAMPHMNGAELLERIAASHPDAAARFVVVTGGAITARMREFVASWRGAYLEKPFSADDLQRALEAVFNAAR